MKLSELRSLTERLVLSDVLIISEVFVNCSELIEDICEFDEALVEALIDADVLADSLALVEALIDADVLADSLALVDALCDAEVLEIMWFSFPVEHLCQNPCLQYRPWVRRIAAASV